MPGSWCQTERDAGGGEKSDNILRRERELVSLFDECSVVVGRLLKVQQSRLGCELGKKKKKRKRHRLHWCLQSCRADGQKQAVRGQLEAETLLMNPFIGHQSFHSCAVLLYRCLKGCEHVNSFPSCSSWCSLLSPSEKPPVSGLNFIHLGGCESGCVFAVTLND